MVGAAVGIAVGIDVGVGIRVGVAVGIRVGDGVAIGVIVADPVPTGVGVAEIVGVKIAGGVVPGVVPGVTPGVTLAPPAQASVPIVAVAFPTVDNWFAFTSSEWAKSGGIASTSDFVESMRIWVVPADFGTNVTVATFVVCVSAFVISAPTTSIVMLASPLLILAGVATINPVLGVI